MHLVCAAILLGLHGVDPGGSGRGDLACTRAVGAAPAGVADAPRVEVAPKHLSCCPATASGADWGVLLGDFLASEAVVPSGDRSPGSRQSWPRAPLPST